MKEYVELMTSYNARTNEALYGILAKLPEEAFSRNAGSYFGSIRGVLSHVYNADHNWLVRVRRAFPHYRAVAGAEFAAPLPLSTPQFADFTTLHERRLALDAAYLRLSSELLEADLSKPFEYTTTEGSQRRFIFWQVLVHAFNHQTHHRGQVAEILDEMKIENDYSNVVLHLKPAP